MIKIGEFSRLAQVSIKTLRHYALVRLFEPVFIDRFSGYRYYSLEQLPRLNRILALKDLGFTLEQIKQLLNERIGAGDLRGMLRIKKVELTRHLQEEQMRLARVEKRLEQIEIEGCSSDRDVVLKAIPASQVAWAHSQYATIEQADSIREQLRELIFAWCVTNKIHLSGPWFSLIENSRYSESIVDIHLGVPIEEDSNARSKTSSGPVRISYLNSIPLSACLLSDSVGKEPHTELLNWIEVNGYRPCGETRLVYLGETAETPLGNRVIEIQTPVQSVFENTEVSLISKESEMKPIKYETLPAFKVMGIKYHGKNENDEIGLLWKELYTRTKEIPMDDLCAFGVCLMIGDAPQGVFEYVAGFKVASNATPPEGMMVMEVPENHYAVFEHRGSLDSLRNTYNLIVNEWFPHSGKHPTSGYDMEVYDEKFKDNSPDSIMYIYEPVK